EETGSEKHRAIREMADLAAVWAFFAAGSGNCLPNGNAKSQATPGSEGCSDSHQARSRLKGRNSPEAAGCFVVSSALLGRFKPLAKTFTGQFLVLCSHSSRLTKCLFRE
ncbi:MAG: hypothetical protein AAFR36_31805, partial [Bacteroidota bacterium]